VRDAGHLLFVDCMDEVLATIIPGTDRHPPHRRVRALLAGTG